MCVRGSWSISALEMIDRHPANHRVLRPAFLTGYSLPCIFATISELANCFDTPEPKVPMPADVYGDDQRFSDDPLITYYFYCYDNSNTDRCSIGNSKD